MKKAERVRRAVVVGVGGVRVILTVPAAQRLRDALAACIEEQIDEHSPPRGVALVATTREDGGDGVGFQFDDAAMTAEALVEWIDQQEGGGT
jgi:hypothetical protein